MPNIKIFMGLVLASGLLIGPAQAQLLTLGNGGSGGNNTTSVNAPGVASVNLGSGSSGTQANASLLNGGGSALNVDLSSLLGSDSGVSATLPGTGGSRVDGLLGGVAGTTDAVTGTDGTADTLLSSLLGGDGGLGSTAGGNGNGAVAGEPGGLNGAGLGGAVGSARCVSDARGIARLLQMRYSAMQMAQWKRASGIHVVKVPVCAQIRGNVARTAALNTSIGAVQGMAAYDPLISASLQRAHLSAGRVIGVGQANGDLTVYVY